MQKLKQLLLKRNKKEFKEILSANAAFNANEKDEQGKTLLHYAVMQGDLEITQQLIERGADISLMTPNGNTALHLAVKKGYFNLVDALLRKEESKSLLKTKNKLGQTPLHLAAKLSNDRIYQTLLTKQPGYDRLTLDEITLLRKKRAQQIKIKSFFVAFLESLCPSASAAELTESFVYAGLLVGASAAFQLGLNIAFAGVAFLGLGLLTFANYKKIQAEKHTSEQLEQVQIELAYIRNIKKRVQQLFKPPQLTSEQKQELKLMREALFTNPKPLAKKGNETSAADYVTRKEKLITLVSGLGSFLCTYSGFLGVVGLGLSITALAMGVGVGTLIASAGPIGIASALGVGLVLALALALYHYRKCKHDFSVFGEQRMAIEENIEALYDKKNQLLKGPIMTKINNLLEDKLPEKQIYSDHNQYEFHLLNKRTPKQDVFPADSSFGIKNV